MAASDARHGEETDSTATGHAVRLLAGLASALSWYDDALERHRESPLDTDDNRPSSVPSLAQAFKR